MDSANDTVSAYPGVAYIEYTSKPWEHGATDLAWGEFGFEVFCEKYK